VSRFCARFWDNFGVIFNGQIVQKCPSTDLSVFGGVAELKHIETVTKMQNCVTRAQRALSVFGGVGKLKL